MTAKIAYPPNYIKYILNGKSESSFTSRRRHNDNLNARRAATRCAEVWSYFPHYETRD